jgi:Spy/CpxP family protein refolding chaperone
MGGPQFPGAGGGGGIGGPQFPGGNRDAINVPVNGPQSGQRPPDGGRAGLQLGPAGQRWWDDRGYVKNLKLRPEQQARMDAIFEQNRTALVSHFESVQQAEAQLNELASTPEPDEGALFAQIDRVEQARADLEKANTHLLLQLRKEMDPEQIQKLESRR